MLFFIYCGPSNKHANWMKIICNNDAKTSPNECFFHGKFGCSQKNRIVNNFHTEKYPLCRYAALDIWLNWEFKVCSVHSLSHYVSCVLSLKIGISISLRTEQVTKGFRCSRLFSKYKEVVDIEIIRMKRGKSNFLRQMEILMERKVKISAEW